MDVLTGLADRAAFNVKLAEAQARFERDREGFAVLAIDLDRFKHVNDTLGHRSAMRCSARSPSGCA